MLKTIVNFISVISWWVNLISGYTGRQNITIPHLQSMDITYLLKWLFLKCRQRFYYTNTRND